MRLQTAAAWLLWAGASVFLGRVELRSDDAGVVAGLILLVAFLTAALDPRHPWKWALLTGPVVPFVDVFLRSPRMRAGAGLVGLVAFTLALGLAGSYAGAMVRRAMPSRGRPAA